MGLDVYFRRDIANVLRATACSSEGAARLAGELLGEPGQFASESEQERLLQAYREGVRTTLVSVGLAFGLEPAGSLAGESPAVRPGLAGLLWVEAPREG